MQQPVSHDLFGRLEELNSIGVSLSKEKDITRLLEKILIAAKSITNADGFPASELSNAGSYGITTHPDGSIYFFEGSQFEQRGFAL